MLTILLAKLAISILESRKGVKVTFGQNYFNMQFWLELIVL